MEHSGETDKMTYGYTPEEYRKFKKYGIRYMVLFSVLYCAMYCTRLNLSNASAMMISEWNLSTSDIGMLTGVLFWCYGIGMMVNGRLCEIFSTNLFVAIAAIGSAAMSILFGFADSLAAMAFLWGLNGFFQSMSWPAGIQGLTGWWPGKSRGFADGFTAAFVGFGQAMATLVVTLGFALFPSSGVRTAFLFPAVFPLLCWLLFRVFTRPYPEKIGLRAYREEDPEIAANEEALRKLSAEHGKLYPYLYLLQDRSIVICLVLAFLTYIVRYGLTTWIPLYFIDRFGVDVNSGLFASLALPIGMGIGCFIVPTVTDHIKNRLILVPVCSLLSAAAIGGIYFLNPVHTFQLILIEILLFLVGFFIYAITGIVTVVLSDVCGRVFSGTANGMSGFANYIGAGLQSFIYGALLRSTGWGVVFASMCAISVFCAFAIFLPDKKRREHI